MKLLTLKVNFIFEQLVPKTKQTAFNLGWNEILAKVLDKSLEVARIQQLQIKSDSKLLVPEAQLKTEGGLQLG